MRAGLMASASFTHGAPSPERSAVLKAAAFSRMASSDASFVSQLFFESTKPIRRVCSSRRDAPGGPSSSVAHSS
jgi:hypothetical protein